MLAKLQTAREEAASGKTTMVAYLKATTGATRSSVRMWLHNGREMPRLGRPTCLTEAEEATVASAMEVWTASGGLLTREMTADTLRD